jgi:hypothetical protein
MLSGDNQRTVNAIARYGWLVEALCRAIALSSALLPTPSHGSASSSPLCATQDCILSYDE